jgi:SNF2 family DNA or RNA helicase
MGALLEDEMGVGKTIQAVVAATKVIVGPILVIARPLSMEEVWVSTIRQMDPEAEIVVANRIGFDYDKVRSWFEGQRVKRQWLIVYHEMLMTPTSRTTGKLLNDRASDFRSLGMWSLIIADESHRFASRKAQVTKSLWSIPTARKWALTGTAMDKSPNDYWTTLHWFDPKRFGSFYTFSKMYTKDMWVRHRRVTIQINTQAFARELAPYRLRRLKVDVRPDIPKINTDIVKVDMSQEQAELYATARKATFLPIWPNLDDPLFIGSQLVRIARLRQIVLDPMLIEAYEISSGKVAWLYNFTNVNQVPTIIFTTSRMFADSLPLVLDGFKSISGSMKTIERMQVIKEFRAGKIQGIVATIATMSESVNLREAEIAIFADSHWSTRSMDQAAARVHRIDTQHEVNILYLETPHTVDELIRETLREKKSVRQLVEMYIKHLKEK